MKLVVKPSPKSPGAERESSLTLKITPESERAPVSEAPPRTTLFLRPELRIALTHRKGAGIGLGVSRSPRQ